MKPAHIERRKIYMIAAAAAAAFVALAAAVFFRGPAPVSASLPALHELPPRHEGRAADYMRDCVTSVLNGAAIPEACRTPEEIAKAYGLDVWTLFQSEYAAAADTAQKIVNGDIMRREDYRACLQRGECRLLPLPRKEDSPEKYDAGVAFLQRLAAGGGMDAQTCAVIDMCRALAKAGIYTPAARERE